MAASIIEYLKGKHLTSVSITPLTVGSAGALTSGTAATVAGQVRSFDVESIVETEDIRGLNSENANADNISYDAKLNLEILLKKAANTAMTNAMTYDRFLVAVVASGITTTFYGILTSFSMGVQNRGGNTYRLSFTQFTPIDTGAEVGPTIVESA